MMKYLEMNIKSKTFLTKQYALRLETNTRKIKSNIDKYIGDNNPHPLSKNNLSQLDLIEKQHAFAHLKKTKYLCRIN